MIASTRKCVDTIAENAQYVLDEVSKLALEPALRDEVVSTFQALSSTIEFDVRGELRAMTEKLELDSPGQFANHDPARNGKLILNWLRSDLNAMNKLIDRLSGGDVEPSPAALRILLRESGANILRAYAAMKRTIGETSKPSQDRIT